MRLFNRRAAPPAADTTASPTTHHPAPPPREKRGLFSRSNGTTTHHRDHHDSATHTTNARPRFGQWLKFVWLDIVTMAVMGAIGLGVYMADPAPSRSFPVTFRDGEVVYPEFAYPLRNEIVPIWAAALLAFFIPFIVFLIVQIRARSFWDVNNATIGLLYALITAAVFQVFIKWLIGGLRPHFLAVCKPVIPDGLLYDTSSSGTDSGLGNVGNGYRQLMFDRSICTGDKSEINDSLESMPSGHTTAAFAGFVFLYLYLNAKLKVFANYHPQMWKLVAIYAPILGACLIGGALTIDEYHNWYDILAGAIIGTTMAFSSYRMVYASIWDFRFNHLPLRRGVPFSYGADAQGFHDALFTRQAGWGVAGAGVGGGAPGDASALAGGVGGGVSPEGYAGHGVGAHGNGQGLGHSRGTGSVARKPVHGEQMV